MSAVYGLTVYYCLCPSVLKYLSTWVYYVLFSLSRRTRVYTVYEFTMYFSLCPGVLKYLSEYMVLQCTVFSVQAYLSPCLSTWVYNVKKILSRRTQVYTVYGFTLSRLTQLYTVYGFTMYYFLGPG